MRPSANGQLTLALYAFFKKGKPEGASSKRFPKTEARVPEQLLAVRNGREMKVSSLKSRPGSLVCPLCEVHELSAHNPNLAKREVPSERFDYYRGHRAGSETRRDRGSSLLARARKVEP